MTTAVRKAKIETRHPHAESEHAAMHLSFVDRLFQKGGEIFASRLNVAPTQAATPKGVLSISFDDFPKSAWHTAGPILAAAGAKATYFASHSCCGQSFAGVEQYALSDLVALHAAGHEIGCHTDGHLAGLHSSPSVFAESSYRNTQFLSEIAPSTTIQSFAYPYGQAPLAHRRLLAGRFSRCRSTLLGLNRKTFDRSLLRAVGLEKWRNRKYNVLASIEALTQQAARERAWLIVFTHDVSESPSPFGCTPSELRAVLSMAAEAGLTVLPIKDVELKSCNTVKART